MPESINQNDNPEKNVWIRGFIWYSGEQVMNSMLPEGKLLLKGIRPKCCLIKQLYFIWSKLGHLLFLIIIEGGFN